MPRFRRISDVFVLTILALSFIGSSGWARFFPSETGVPESPCRLSALLTAATRPVPHTTRIGDVSVTVALATGSGSTVLVLNLASAVAAVMPLEARWSVTGSSGNQYIQTLWKSVAPFAEVSPATVVVTCRPTGPTGANNSALTINTTYSDGTVITLSFRAAPTGEDDHLSLSAALVVRGEAAANVTALRFVRRDVQPGDGPVFGLGEQYNTLGLRGWRLPVYTREQGVGRGEQPITEVLNAFDFVGGSNKTNYAARPLYLFGGRDRSQFFVLSQPSAYSVFDFSELNSTFSDGYQALNVTINATSFGAVLCGHPVSNNATTTPLAMAVRALTAHAGLPRLSRSGPTRVPLSGCRAARTPCSPT
jgi:hypothetical protein